MSDATAAFAALGHEGRLALLRLLFRHAPHGVRAGAIAGALGIPPSTASAHLAALEAAGLIRARRAGRAIYYAADVAATGRLAAFLIDDTGHARPDLYAALANPEPRPMRNTDFDVLFICSGNSARSIFAEALLRDLGRGKFQAFSAGYNPARGLNPFALEVLQRNGHSIEGLRSKHVSEFQAPGAPEMNFVFTVCDLSANEECPPWPGQPITGHWGLPDPVQATGTDAEKALAFAKTYAELRRRIAAFVELPFETLDRIALQKRVDALGESVPARG